MNHKFAQYFFPGVLIVCLFVGIHANLIEGSRLLMLLLSALVLIAAHFIAPQLNKLSRRHFAYLLGGGLLLMLVGQIWSLSAMPVTVYHDPFRVLAQADQLAAGNHVWTSTYFWRYANNVPLAYLLSLWLRLGTVVGLSTNAAIHLLSLLTLDGFIILLLHTVYAMSRRNSVTFAAFTFAALTPFAYTYYLQVFYSDLPTMFVLLGVMNLLRHWQQSSHRQRIYRGIGLTLLTMLGYLLKPSLIVLIPALALTAIILGTLGLLKKSKLLVPALLIVLGIGLSVPATKSLTARVILPPTIAMLSPSPTGSTWVITRVARVNTAVKIPARWSPCTVSRRASSMMLSNYQNACKSWASLESRNSGRPNSVHYSMCMASRAGTTAATAQRLSGTSKMQS
ncbi:MAG: hypothetical protein LKG24_03525 [Lacticaseibacillus songhuajiangensis]|jgi:hypothetical protein|nr:hypothetical protein [Lacticaseibacillus songhuajiangensis]